MLNFLKKGITRHAGKLALGAGVVTIGLGVVFFLFPPAGAALWISLLAVLIASGAVTLTVAGGWVGIKLSQDGANPSAEIQLMLQQLKQEYSTKHAEGTSILTQLQQQSNQELCARQAMAKRLDKIDGKVEALSESLGRDRTDLLEGQEVVRASLDLLRNNLRVGQNNINHQSNNPQTLFGFADAAQQNSGSNPNPTTTATRH